MIVELALVAWHPKRVPPKHQSFQLILTYQRDMWPNVASFARNGHTKFVSGACWAQCFLSGHHMFHGHVARATNPSETDVRYVWWLLDSC